MAYITAPWGANEFENTETAVRYCRKVYDLGFSPVCPMLFLSLFLDDAIPQEHKDSIAIAIAERLRITATTLDGLLTVKGQGREKIGNGRTELYPIC